MLSAILREMRIAHYLKNLVVFIPLLYKSEPETAGAFWQIVMLGIAFCLISSTVYIINDLKDKESDSRAPYKKLRPIAQNLITFRQACLIATILAISSVSITLPLSCTRYIIAYLLLNIIYSYALQKIFYIDAGCIALGFIIRISASQHLIHIPDSMALTAWIFFTSCFFTFVKRKLELNLAEQNKSLLRESLQKVSLLTIQKIILINATLSIACFCILLNEFPHTIRFYIAILTYTGFLIRLIQLSDKHPNFDDPINFLKKDNLLKFLIIIFIATFII